MFVVPIGGFELILLFLVSIFFIILFIGLKLILFTPDVVILFLVSVFLSNKYVSPIISEGNAIRFWNIVFGVFVVLCYLFTLLWIRDRFDVLVKVINFCISFVSTFVLYIVIVIIIRGSDTYPPLFSLLRNDLANTIVNLLFVITVSYFVWKKREDILDNIHS